MNSLLSRHQKANRQLWSKDTLEQLGTPNPAGILVNRQGDIQEVFGQPRVQHPSMFDEDADTQTGFDYLSRQSRSKIQQEVDFAFKNKASTTFNATNLFTESKTTRIFKHKRRLIMNFAGCSLSREGYIKLD